MVTGITQHSTNSVIVRTPMMELPDVEHIMRRGAPVNNNKKPRSRAMQLKKTTPYAVRKERKQILAEQAATMQKKLDKLKLRMLVEQGEMDDATKSKIAQNSKLHKFIQEQHLVLAAMQASLNGRVQRSVGSLQPMQTVVHMGMDRAQRYKVLMSLKKRKLYEAERYLATRSEGLEPGVVYCREERFDTADGDTCIGRFETAPICAGSAKTVFDAILGFVMNAEIFLTELFGSVSIREDDDFESSEFSQLRSVSLTSSGARVESNTVVFSKFVEGAEGELGSYGIMVEDFVDIDDLHPYQTDGRVRRDTTAIIMVRAVPTKDGSSPMIMVTRWSILKMHNGDSDISRNPETEMKESSVCWGETAHTCVQQQLTSAAAADSP